MAVGVVEEFEVVDIEQGDREREAGALAAMPFTFELLVERASVVEAGEPIAEGVAGDEIGLRLEAQLGADARLYDGLIEGLGDVVCGAQFEAVCLVVSIDERGDEDDGDEEVALFTHSLAH